MIGVIFAGVEAQAVELNWAQAHAYLQACTHAALHKALSEPSNGLAYFSKHGVEPSVDFVIPINSVLG
jgi:hypothetical protein